MRLRVEVSQPHGAAPSADAWHYPVVLKRRWKIVAALTVLGLLLGLAYLLLAKPTYSASTSVNINAISSQPFNQARPSSGLLDAQTEQSLVPSSRVAQEVSDALDGRQSTAQARSGLSAVLPVPGTVMRINFSAGSAADARLGVTTAAEEYLLYRSSLAQDRQQAIAKNLRDQQKDLRVQLRKVNAAIFSTAARSTARTQAVSDRQALTISLSTLSTQLSLISGIDTTGGTILTQ